MFRNYLSAALNNLIRNKLYAAINIVGLAVGFAAAILIGLYLRNELSYDRWIPGSERLYSVYTIFNETGRRPLVVDATGADFAASLKLDFPEIEDATRLQMVSHALRHGEMEANENLYWADANLLSVLQLPVVAGDPNTALRRPDSIVLTQRMARKYFGSEDVIGKTVEIDRLHPMQVTAVLKDFPSNTNLIAEVFASGKATFSDLAVADRFGETSSSGGVNSQFVVLFRLKLGAAAERVSDKLPDFLRRHRKLSPQDSIRLKFVPLTGLHLKPSEIHTMAPQSDIATVTAVAAVAVLILIIAVINFINLMTAHASGRAIEVGVRKTVGASRGDLMVQFIGDAVLYVVVSAIFALALTELLLPVLNAYLGRNIAFHYWREPGAILAATLFVLAVGVAAGAYPAFVLSAFLPSKVLAAGKAKTSGAHGGRQAMVVLQFAILIGLVIAAGVVSCQTQFALNEGLKLNKDLVVLITGPCHTALEINIRKLPGVRDSACSSKYALNIKQRMQNVALPSGRDIEVNYMPLDFNFFEFYGLKPLAGRFFAEKYGADTTAKGAGGSWHPTVVVNESALRLLGLKNPADAIGKTVTLYDDNTQRRPSEIVGVVKDFALRSLRNSVGAAVYYIDGTKDRYLNVRLTRERIPETLSAIDEVWVRSGPPLPIRRVFLDTHMEEIYRDIIRQGEVFTLFAGLAVLIACLGLFALSAFLAAQRTKEIGIRKAMGADTGAILRLLLWQFAKPVLWGNLIAWPVAGYLMWHWLQGFAYRIALPLWLFPTAATLAFVVAILTVLVHSLLVARARPVVALRYE